MFIHYVAFTFPNQLLKFTYSLISPECFLQRASYTEAGLKKKHLEIECETGGVAEKKRGIFTGVTCTRCCLSAGLCFTFPSTSALVPNDGGVQ